MRLPKVKAAGLRSGNTEVDAVLRDLVNSAADVDEVLGQVFLENVTLSDGVTAKIPHKLGRKLKGWTVVRCNTAGVTFHDLQDSNPKQDETLWLQPTGGSPRITLMVF